MQILLSHSHRGVRVPSAIHFKEFRVDCRRIRYHPGYHLPPNCGARTMIEACQGLQLIQEIVTAKFHSPAPIPQTSWSDGINGANISSFKG